MEKYRKKLLFILFAICILSIMNSCGARKVNKSIEVVKESVTQTDSTKTTTDTSEHNTVNSVIDAEEIEVTPIDSAKPMIVNGKVYKNARVKAKKSKAAQSVVSDKKSSTVEQKAVKTVAKKESVKEVKQIDRKAGFNYWWLLLLLIPIGYYLYRKFRIL